jgi:hypothetical protein
LAGRRGVAEAPTFCFWSVVWAKCWSSDLIKKILKKCWRKLKKYKIFMNRFLGY